MDPSNTSPQQPPAIKHMMSIPEKIELTSTGAYPTTSQSSPVQRQDSQYRAMRVPDKIMLETTTSTTTPTGESGEVQHSQGGSSASSGARGYFNPM